MGDTGTGERLVPDAVSDTSDSSRAPDDGSPVATEGDTRVTLRARMTRAGRRPHGWRVTDDDLWKRVTRFGPMEPTLGTPDPWSPPTPCTRPFERDPMQPPAGAIRF